MRLALTREVSGAIERCELTHRPRKPIDVALAREQHRRYETLLSELGCTVVRLPSEPDMPDAVFVEDTAVVLDEIAVIARPGAPARRGEISTVASALEPFRNAARIEPPGTLDGGDVLVLDRTVYAGLSSRTNGEGIEQLARILSAHGYIVRSVPVAGCLHLKSAVTRVAASTVLLNPGWVDAEAFEGWERIEADPSEPFGANALLVGDTVVHPSEFPGTRRRLEERGLRVVTLDVSELAKAEGGVTCCSLVFDVLAEP